MGKKVSESKIHKFTLAIYPPIMSPFNLTYQTIPVLIEKTGDVGENDTLATYRGVDIKAPFNGTFTASVANRREIDYVTQIGTLEVKIDLLDFEKVRKAFLTAKGFISVRSKNTLGESSNAVEQFMRNEAVYCRVGVAPGYEHFDKVVDSWVEFIRENKFPKIYHTYKYFRNVCEEVFKLKETLQDSGTVSFIADSAPVVKDFDFSKKDNMQLFISKI